VSNRPSRFTQAEIERAIRAGKKAGLPEVRIKIGDQSWLCFPLTENAAIDSAFGSSESSRWGD
jgi:hypothetical protein